MAPRRRARGGLRRRAGKRHALPAALALALGWGCSDEGADDASSEPYPTVLNLDRGPGMLIGQGAAGPGGDAEDEGLDEEATDTENLDVPEFETRQEEFSVPCSGCVELRAVVDDINQRNDFEFDAAGVAVESVTWTLLIPFNSDQLFIRSVVGGADGAYLQLHANDFAVNEPFELAHAFNGTPADRVGMAMGSAGAWTGNQPMRLFVDAVTLSLADGSTETRTFDEGPEGMAPRTPMRRDARVVHHP